MVDLRTGKDLNVLFSSADYKKCNKVRKKVHKL